MTMVVVLSVLNTLLLVVNAALLSRSYRAGRLKGRRLAVQGALFAVAGATLVTSVGLGLAA